MTAGTPSGAVRVLGIRRDRTLNQLACRACWHRPCHLGTTTGFSLGYVAVDGDRALVGFTGTVCQPGQHPECVTNRDPAAIFSTAKPFATLWTESIASANSPILSYALTPCMRISGRWYLYSPTGQSASPV